MHSCIYEGYVRHRRFTPVHNVFQYRLYMLFLDLAELPQVFEGRCLWSYGHPNLAFFRRRDHLGHPLTPLDESVKDLVAEELGERPQGPIRLLTHLRYFGFCFNPVSFYYCYDPMGRNVESLVVEIHNTPWNEEYCYVFGKRANEHPVQGWQRFQFTKAFHVSPFMEMEIHYDWRFREPGESLSVHMNNLSREEKRFDASLTLQRSEITGHTLARVLIAYPFMTAKVVTMIYWQALRLRIKGAPVHPHPKKRLPAPKEIAV
jgi:DUF1365 family protein